MAGFEIIAHEVLSSATAYAEITSIPQTYQHLYLVGSTRSTRSAYYDGSRIRFNGEDDSGDYTYAFMVLYGPSSPGSGDTIGDPATGISYAMDGPAADNEANIYSASHLWILDYANTSKYTGVIGGTSAPGYSGDIYDYQQTIVHGHSTFTAAVTSMRIINGVGNWAADTAFTLYGLNSA